jgi:hypothetical protein
VLWGDLELWDDLVLTVDLVLWDEYESWNETSMSPFDIANAFLMTIWCEIATSSERDRELPLRSSILWSSKKSFRGEIDLLSCLVMSKSEIFFLEWSLGCSALFLGAGEYWNSLRGEGSVGDEQGDASQRDLRCLSILADNCFMCLSLVAFVLPGNCRRRPFLTFEPFGRWSQAAGSRRFLTVAEFKLLARRTLGLLLNLLEKFPGSGRLESEL